MAMREIKFRAWEESLDYMHKGSEHFSMCLDKEGELSHHDIIFMQYTGLKDKNGVEIYEGDIIEYSTTIKATETKKHIDYAEVVFNNGCFMYLVHDKDDNYYASLLEEDEKQWAEVIGNIYENKELLEQ